MENERRFGKMEKMVRKIRKRKLETLLLVCIISISFILFETWLCLEETYRSTQEIKDTLEALRADLERERSSLYSIQKYYTYVVGEGPIYYYLQNGTSGELVDYSPDDDAIVGYAVGNTTSHGGSVLIKAGFYSASVKLKDNVTLVIEKGASNITVTIDAGATAWLYDCEKDAIKHWSDGILVFHLEDGNLKAQSLDSTEYWQDGTNRTDIIANPLLVADWIVYREGDYFKAKDCTNQNITWVDKSPSAVIQNVLNCGGVIFIKNDVYSLDVIPLNITMEYTRITGNYPNITIPDGKMVGSTTNVATWAIFQIKCSHVELDHLIIDGNGDGQSYSPYWGSEEGLITIWKERWNTNDLKSTNIEEEVRIHDCTIKDAYVTSIAVNKFNKVEISNNIIDKIRYTVDGTPARGVNIHITWSNDSWIHNNYVDIYSTWTGSSNNIYLYRGGDWTDVNSCSARVIIENNICMHCMDSAVEAFGGLNNQPNNYHHQILITNNIVHGAQILFSNNVRDSEISNNVINFGSSESGWNPGIALWCHVGSNASRQIRNILIHGNVVSGLLTNYAHNGGVSLRSNGGVIQDVEISDNQVHDIGAPGSSFGNGIVIQGDGTVSPNHITRIKIHGNKIYNMGKHGISVENTVAEAEIALEDNEIYNNGKYSIAYGISIAGNGSFTIRGNNIYDDQNQETQDGGIYVTGSATYGRILSNRIESGMGLTLGSNTDNWWVANNDFYGCTTDVIDNSDGTTVYSGNRNEDGNYVDGGEP